MTVNWSSDNEALEEDLMPKKKEKEKSNRSPKNKIKIKEKIRSNHLLMDLLR